MKWDRIEGSNELILLITGRNELGETTSMSWLPPLGAAGSLPESQLILVGVSTEVTVAIALASFIIGVALTAVLWCIHMRTGTN